MHIPTDFYNSSWIDTYSSSKLKTKLGLDNVLHHRKDIVGHLTTVVGYCLNSIVCSSLIVELKQTKLLEMKTKQALLHVELGKN